MKRFCASLLSATALSVSLAEEPYVDFAQFETHLNMYCVACHNSERTDGDVDFETYGSQHALMSRASLLDNMEWAISEEEMPPQKAKKMPPPRTAKRW